MTAVLTPAETATVRDLLGYGDACRELAASLSFLGRGLCAAYGRIAETDDIYWRRGAYATGRIACAQDEIEALAQAAATGRRVLADLDRLIGEMGQAQARIRAERLDAMGRGE